MNNLWNRADAAGFPGDVGQRVYSSRLIGREPSLVLHGGGNTSVKTSERDLFGAEVRVLRIKASGSDLATICAANFAPCRMDHLLRLSALASLTDERMAAELRISLTDPAAQNPSVEAILHALVPAKYVDHTHAEALLAISNTGGGRQRVEEAYGGRVLVLPYVMPGFALARQAAREMGSLPKGAIGIVLLGHGLVSFGETAEESYSRMIELVGMAESYLESRGALNVSWEPAAPLAAPQRAALALFRKELCSEMGCPAIVTSRQDARTIGFARRADLTAASQEGPATPDHAIRTKRVPLVGRGIASYRAAYESYFNACSAKADPKPARLDSAPRIVVDPEWGLLAAGRTAAEATAAADIYSRTEDIIARAAVLGGWKGLPAQDIFDVEYWDLEQAKLRQNGRTLEFGGEIAVVTGAASGIGKACTDSFLARGAAVVGLDVNPAVASVHPGPAYLGIQCDLTDEGAVGRALESSVRAFGGVDMLVVNAGIFPPSSPIGALATDQWRKAMAVNLDAGMVLLRECHPLLRAAPAGGRVVVIASKNVPAPGPGAAAYSASKAALTQLARVAALEWGADRIRVNIVHPNMVFDTALWTRELLQARAHSYGMSVETYRTNNLLRAKVTSRDVAEMAAALCGAVFSRTTGAQVPVDGGNERVL